MDKTTLEELKSHPAVIEIQRKHEAETLEQRRQWAGELEQAQVAKMKNLPPLKQTLDEKQAAVDAAKATLKQAEAEASQAAAALEREAQRLNGVISGLDGQLRETAPAAIDQAIEFFRDKFYELRAQAILSAGRHRASFP